jgi:hypothetical protein
MSVAGHGGPNGPSKKLKYYHLRGLNWGGRKTLSEAALTNGFNSWAAESGWPASTGSEPEPVPKKHPG